MTLAPRAERFTAVLRPSPRLPPVMIATLSFKVPTVSFAIGTPFTLLKLSVAFCTARSCDMRFKQSTSLTVRMGRVGGLFRFEVGTSFQVGNNPRLLRPPFQLLLS